MSYAASPTPAPPDSYKFLRLHDEPCTHFGEREVHSVLMAHTNAFMDLLEAFYRRWKTAADIVHQPRKTVFTTEGTKGDWRVMPCFIDDFSKSAIKAVKVIGTNEEEKVVRDKISVGKALLIHPSDHFVQATFDVCALSSFRTAALSVLAWKHASDRTQPVGIIGAGRIGFYTAHILASWLGVDKARIHDVQFARAQDLNRLLRPFIDLHPQPLGEVIGSSSSLFVATNSSRPIVAADTAAHLTFISSVGADADNLSELDCDLLKRWSVVSESTQNIHFGDMRRWKDAALLRAESILELRKAIDEPVPAGRKTLFISTGTAIQDALLCQFLFNTLQEARADKSEIEDSPVNGLLRPRQKVS